MALTVSTSVLLAVLLSAASAAPALAPAHGDGARTAFAVLHEAGGIWGSVVFSQASRSAPVLVTASLHNVDVSGGAVHFALHEEPVHYGLPGGARCGVALGRVLRASGASGGPAAAAETAAAGALSAKHGAIRTGRHSLVAYDGDLSLWAGESGYVVQRAFAVRQGGAAAARHACATVYRVADGVTVPPGAVPCERVRYPDCAMGVARGRCTRRECFGLRQFWGIRDVETSAVDASTTFCTQRAETAPVVMAERAGADGMFACSLGRSTGLHALSRAH